MLKSLHAFRDVVSIVPFSGIQFLDFGFNVNQAQKVTGEFFDEILSDEAAERSETSLGLGDGEAMRRTRFRVHRLAEDRETEELTSQVDRDRTLADLARGPSADREPYQVNSKRALEGLLDTWLPLPVLRRRERDSQGNPVFDTGPTNWVRIRVIELDEPDDDGNTHRVVLAVDTSLFERSEVRGYPAPSLDDAEREDEFVLMHEAPAVSWFISFSWIQEWLRRCYVAKQKPRAGGQKFNLAEIENPGEPFARYMVLLEFLAKALSAPSFRLIDTITPASTHKTVPVDLVLDFGNSRTCGVLIEQQGQDEDFDLSQSYPLELRDLGRPERVCSEPFESRVEFSRGDFGPPELSKHSGRQSAFNWHSLVRIGPEATRLANHTVGMEGATGLSSPKRYLWDGSEAEIPWRFNGRSADGAAIEPLVSGSLFKHLTDKGDVLASQKKTGRRARPAMSPMFSRSSMFTFALAEVLYQALSQINAPATRGKRRLPNEPRRLRRVILTLPPAMPLPERRLMRERAEAAVDLVAATVKDASKEAVRGYQRPVEELSFPERPEVNPRWDEASATHLVYLYTQIKQRFNGQVRQFFQIMGKRRSGGETLRLASIDIGGGTTDLMVTTYQQEAGQALIPTQNFRESLRVAGDDILQAVIEQQVLVDLRRALAEEGVEKPETLLSELFSGDFAGVGEQERHLRKQFVNQVLVPVGLHLMHQTEQADLSATPPNRSLTLDEALARNEPPDSRTFGYLEERVRQRTGRPFDARAVQIELDHVAIADTIAGVMDNSLALLSEAIHALDCDVLLVSGRPSRLPGIQHLLLRHLPVPAGRVVPMHTFQVGGWYPFRDALGRIRDPKTTAVVGAALCELAEGQIRNFVLHTNQMTLKSTAHFIGQMDDTDYVPGTPERPLLFSNVDLDSRKASDAQMSTTVKMYSPMDIGFRQLPIARWPAQPLYHLAPVDRAHLRKHPTPWQITIVRSDPQDEDQAEEKKEEFKVEEVVDRSEAAVSSKLVQLRLQTLRHGSYWLDTGALRVT
jgi:hypothetical protein